MGAAGGRRETGWKGGKARPKKAAKRERERKRERGKHEANVPVLPDGTH